MEVRIIFSLKDVFFEFKELFQKEKFMSRSTVTIVLGILICLPVLCWAADQEKYTLIIKDHKFVPDQLVIPANQKIKLIVDNQDLTEEEFESYELNREKVVSGGKQIVIYLGPLKQGSYQYFGDFNPKTARGTIVVQ